MVLHWRKELTLSIIIGQRVGRQAFTSAVGIESREQVEGLALLTSSVITEVSTEVEDNGGQAAEGATSCDRVSQPVTEVPEGVWT